MRHILKLSLLTTTLLSCTPDSSETDSEFEHVSSETRILPSEDLPDRMREAITGDSEAVVLIASHYLTKGGAANDLAAIGWLSFGVTAQRSTEASALLIGYALANGDCSLAAHAVELTDKTGENRGAIISQDLRDEVGDCFSRPIGEGDWSTRKSR